ncbi:hypothetical protein [Rhizobium leguminosarum]|nr:hypothetical protein [Rhizobium leguminosarum]
MSASLVYELAPSGSIVALVRRPASPARTSQEEARRRESRYSKGG